ncbi:MAG: NAD-dependent epimerase [Deltaproteobacteria bacterium]|jgi:UDP-glucuronate 4-epimerase|nr:NAD-dependent epimerase [Deltaproteobacteria bacterium]
MHILVTGAAGFIGFHLAQRLLLQGYSVVGLDNLSEYYNVRLKRDRLELLEQHAAFTFARVDLANGKILNALFQAHNFSHVAHLAAQAGVRHSITNPQSYIQSNLVGFGNMLEACRHTKVRHLVFASSSSVYGLNAKLPYNVQDSVDHPVSLYAASKKANELMAHAYSHLYGLPCTGLRFFTVYGPWGRPDMAPHLFTEAILKGESIKVFNHGDMQRDFTYIDDIVEGVARVIDRIPAPDSAWRAEAPNPATSSAPWRIYNIGNNQPVQLMDFIAALEQALGCEGIKKLMPMQPGDVRATYADIDDFRLHTGFAPSTPLVEGIARFVAWHRDYYRTYP